MNTSFKDIQDGSGIVQLLPDIVINQISAGEVVDRPASVVRELVDNSVDAGARSISVYLEDGGAALIRVVDDGIGMTRGDAERSFQRHATSKIRDTEDLSAIATLGFRGEALPSIASVSRVRMRTQRKNDNEGSEVTINGGVLEGVRPCTIKSGTDIEVRSLFYNTPARKKFLRTARTEEAKVKAWLRHSAVAHPEIHYRYFSEGREVFNLPPRESSVARAKELFKGASIALEEQIENFVVEGLVSHPSLADGDSSSFVLLINGRLVSDRVIMRAVREGFDSTLKSHEYPVGFLSLIIAPHLVDVNVHPQKSEVRFIAPQSIFTLVRSVVRHGVMKFTASLPQQSLRSEHAASKFEYKSPEPLQLIRAIEKEVVSESGDDYDSLKTFFSQPNLLHLSSSGGDFIEPEKIPFSQLRFIGQAFRCYLFAEHAEKLYVVDMHAAHERIMFNKIREQRAENQRFVEKLLIPLSIELSEYQRARIAEYKNAFVEVGFAFTEEKESLKITELPSFLKGADLEQLLHEFANLPEEVSAEGVLIEKLDHIIARKACHSSIRSGRELERQEVYALFERMDKEKLANACPHGRPVVVTFEQAEIEQWFGRDR